ncbi:hypothetical protein EG68_06082 [Paragonimus skrjabini miyazakii]|uniref:VOC domain-containing protein n=1 Tax=Paragonimus skrjabini miyazakii TaxID=59628 RepID=A0A8S9YVA7_9TREM|nr:hypothetical protein EG68_06082 [Paragonimus skrjabini miyazakii]
MSLVRSVHYLQFACKDVWHTYQVFAGGFGYHFHCMSKHGNYVNLVLKNGTSMVMLSESGRPTMCDHPNPYLYEMTNRYMQRDRPFDIALEVHDVNQVCDRLRRLGNGADSILLDPVTHSDYHGKIDMAVIRSCLPGVLHTVLNTSQYKGLFLPGYTVPELGAESTLKRKLQEQKSTIHSDPANIVCLDHIALACRTGELDQVIRWYDHVFGMKRAPANVSDDDVNGFVVKHNDTGMRLKAITPTENVSKSTLESMNSCNFVLVEPLEQSSPNQVTRFLDANGGPGIQHIGLAVSDIFKAVSACRTGGIGFIDPPETYYDQLSQNPSFPYSYVSMDKLRKSGILLDTEVTAASRLHPTGGVAFIMQIFTSALFERDAFFMELIQRCAGASGFGAGNITALWLAVEAALNADRRRANRCPST